MCGWLLRLWCAVHICDYASPIIVEDFAKYEAAQPRTRWHISSASFAFINEDISADIRTVRVKATAETTTLFMGEPFSRWNFGIGKPPNNECERILNNSANWWIIYAKRDIWSSIVYSNRHASSFLTISLDVFMARLIWDSSQSVFLFSRSNSVTHKKFDNMMIYKMRNVYMLIDLF